MDNSLIQIPDLRSLDKALKKLGFDCIEGKQNGVPVLTVTVGHTLFMALIHNQCLKFMYQFREDNFPGGVAFANNWNAMNLIGTLIPMGDGFAFKYECLANHGIIGGNLRDAVLQFADSVDKFIDEWIKLTS